MNKINPTVFLQIVCIFVGTRVLASDLFVEVDLGVAGIPWVHDSGKSPERYLPETMGPGAAFLDYDSDGWLDLYLVNSGPSDFYQPGQPIRSALYRNLGDGAFSDVTLTAGVSGRGFGMGVASADYDNDGDVDLFLTAYGSTTLYQNRGDGTFENATKTAGLEVNGWTTSAVWFDYDNDGWLDLFVCQFVEFSKEQHISCGLNPLGKNYYCVPRVFNPTPSLLFRNLGNGTFRDVGKDSVIGETLGKALGVVATDSNNDGFLDLFVANDTVQDFLFLNRRDQGWEEVGVFAEVGFSTNGEAQSGMGVDAADFDGDGWQDLFVSNIDHQNYSLFHNNRDESYRELSVTQGIAEATYLLSGWGLKFFDFDNDGDLDLFLANGHPDDMIGEYSPQVSYQEPLQLFRNTNGRLEEVSREAGQVFQKDFSARGMAIGDFDNDGGIDVLVANNGAAPLLLRNQGAGGNHWLGLTLESKTSSREAWGARITWSVGGVTRSRLRTPGGSYLSGHDPRVVLGLGDAERVDWVEIEWPSPSPTKERFRNLPVDRYVTIVEGTGESSNGEVRTAN